MWLGTKFTSLSDYLFRSLFRLLFRYDVFISYARRDGKEYALKLRDQLKQLDFSCFVDFDELPPGNSLNSTLRRALKRSAVLVVVGTERAVKSRYVELEVSEFAGTGRAIIPIDIEGTLAQMPWPAVKERDLVWIDETSAALSKGVPAPSVADSIDKLFKYTRRNSRVRAQVLATIAIFFVVVVGSVFMIRQQVQAATLASAEAERQKTEARNQKAAADTATADAVEQKRAANAASAEAASAKTAADKATERATAAEKTAREKAAEAKRQEQNALTNAERAKAQQAIAEEQTRHVLAQQIGVQADLALKRDSHSEASALLSVESLKKSFTPEGYGAWAQAVELLPRPVGAKLAGAGENASAMAYSPDGKQLALGYADGALALFPTDGAGEPVKLLPVLGSTVRVITYGRDGSWVAASSAGQTVMWDIRTRRQIKSLNYTSMDGAVALRPDGRYLAVANRRPFAEVFDTDTGSLVAELKLDTDYVMSVAFSPDGRWLALGCIPGRIAVWDVSDFKKGEAAAVEPAGMFVDEKILIKGVTFSSDGNQLAVSHDGEFISLWDVSYPDAKTEPSARAVKLERSSRTLQLAQATPPRPLHAFRNVDNQYVPAPVVFSPGDVYLAIPLDDNTVRVWEVKSGREVSRLEYPSYVNALAFSPGRSTFATAGVDVNFWSTEFGSAPLRLSDEGHSKLLALTPGGEWLVAAGFSGVRVFRTSDWSLAAAFVEAGRVSKMMFSPDGRWLVTAGEDGVAAFEVGAWKVGRVIKGLGEKPLIGFSPDGRLLAVWGDTSVRLFESGSWRDAHTFTHRDPVAEVSFSPDGRWLGIRTSRQMVYDHAGGVHRRETFVLDMASGQPLACRVEKDPRAASASSQRREKPEDADAKGTACSDVKVQSHEALLAEVQNWKQPLLPGDKSDTSPDGRWLVGADSSGITLSFKEGNTIRQVARLMEGEDVEDWVFTLDGRWLAATGNTAISLWPLQPAQMIGVVCARLRRGELTDDESKNYLPGTRLAPTCSSK
jgi:WD40 repeat protein